MSIRDIPMDKAELLSVLLEALMYGFSVLMFGGTIWTLVFRRSTNCISWKMLSVACALLVCSTAHMIGHIIRVMDGLILYRDTFPGGPSAYFADIAQWTFNFKNYVFVIQVLIGDGVILYRCYMVWKSKRIMIMPILLWCTAGVTGFMSCYSSSIATHPGVFDGSVGKWITSYWVTSLSTNLSATVLLAFRIWHVDRDATELRKQQSPLRPVLQIVIDAGAIYSFTLLVALICFLMRSNAQYVVLDMVTPITSITFYMVIIRVGLAVRASRVNTESTKGKRRTLEVHVSTLAESKFDHGQYSPISPASPTIRKINPSEVKADEIVDSMDLQATRSLVHELNLSSAV